MAISETKPTIKLQRRLPLLLLAVVALGTLLLPSRVWTTLFIGLGGLIIAAYIWARQMAGGLRGSRRLRFGWVSVGDRLSEEFVITNQTSLPALWVEVVDESNVPGYRVAVVRSVSATASDRWRNSAVCTRRGQYRLGPWVLRTADPFGLFEVTIPYPGSEKVVIHPPIYTRAPVPLPAGHSSGQARARSTSHQATINAAGVRAYQPADPLRWIHWPTTARRDDLFVRQFDLDAAGDIWLLLDLQQAAQLGPGENRTADGVKDDGVVTDFDSRQAAGPEPHQSINYDARQSINYDARQSINYDARQSINYDARQGINFDAGTEEFAVLLAATLTARALQQNRAVGLAAYGRQPQLVAPNLGQGQQWKLLEALALATADGQHDLARALKDLGQLARRGSAAIIITPSGHLDWLPELLRLAQRAIAPHVVLLDRVSFGGDGNSEAMRDVLRHQGFQVTVVKQGDLGRPLEQLERRGYWEFKVTGTGKVVTVRSPLER
jgi:uncharacterized protein (DUF58 family)